MRTIRFALLLLVLCSTGCAPSMTYKGLKPVYPNFPHPWRAQMSPREYPDPVETQLTFEWEKAPDPGTTYDLAIWDAIKYSKRRFSWPEKGPYNYNVGRTVYYREGLTETKHEIETPLEPDHDYFWSVRTRKDQQVGPWATYDTKNPGVLNYGETWSKNNLFLITTGTVPDWHMNAIQKMSESRNASE